MLKKRKRQIGAHSAEFAAALCAFFLMLLLPLINLIGVVTGAGTVQLIAKECAVRAGNAPNFDEALNQMQYTAHMLTASGFGKFAKLQPVGGYENSGADLYVYDTNINTLDSIIHGPNTPAVSAMDPDNFIYSYGVIVRYDVGPFLNLSAVPVIGDVPGLGKPWRMTMHADRNIESLVGLHVAAGGFKSPNKKNGSSGDPDDNDSPKKANSGDGGTGISTTSATLMAAAAPRLPWQTASTNGVQRFIPNEFSTWHLQLSGDLILDNNRDVYDTDMYETTVEQIALIHSRGGYAIGYMNAGAWQPGMPDSGLYPPGVIGKKPMQGWPKERWLDIRQIDILRPIIHDKMQLAKDKGFDGVDPDNMDGYSNTKEFGLTEADQIAFNKMVAEEAHAVGLAVFLKNSTSMVSQLEPFFDGAVVEQAFKYHEAAAYSPFRDSHKPVFEVEYRSKLRPADLAEAQQLGFNVILAKRNLTKETKMVTSY